MAEMKEILVANLTLDTTRRNNIPPLIVPQGDYGARVIRAVITEQGKLVTVESAAAVSIVAERSGDGEALAFSGKVNADGSVTVPVTQWMLDVPENYVTCHIEATGIDYKYSTTHFLIEPEKKANPTEITPDDPRKDVVTEVLAGEKDRVIEEAKRRANENTRKSAEEARQRAEEQRLTDEATRVANEAERVSSELSRDATFKGWANDIASLPSFDSRISANSDRLTNIEAGLPSSVWHVDDTAARVKDVPKNARPKAIVNKIGGMTYKTVNLLHYEDNSYTQNGITVTVNNDKSLTIRGTSTAYVWIALASINLTAGEQYTAKATNCPSNAQFYLYHDEDRHFFRNSAYTFTTTQSSYAYVFAIDPNITIDVTVYPMLNEGSTAKPYSPYFEGLRSAKVTEVKSVGRNLCPPFVKGIRINPATGMQYEDSIAASTDFIEIDLENNTYAGNGLERNLLSFLSFYDGSKNWLGRTSAGQRESFTLSKNTGLTIGSLDGVRYVRFTIYENPVVSGTIDLVDTMQVMLNAGDTALPYTPYVEHTLPIPEELRPANGINAEVYDSIEVNENGSVTKRVKCGVADFGTLNWGSWSGDESVFTVSLGAKAKSTNSLLCDKYSILDNNSDQWVDIKDVDKVIYKPLESSYILVRDTDYTNVNIFKAAMSGVMLVYELAEPIVTDTYADLIIDVEGGGTLTFENEHGYDMPNTVTYMLKEVTS